MTKHISAAVLSFIFVASLTAQGDDPKVIQVGIVDSLVKDLSPAKKDVANSEFPGLVKDFTGFTSELTQGGDLATASKNMESKKWHLAVFQGIEFGWLQAKDSKLQPLMLAISKTPDVRAQLVAKKDANLKGFADLKGKNIYHQQIKEHCRLFIEKGVQGDPKAYFAKYMPTHDPEAALDDILRGKADAAVVDNSSLTTYKETFPGRYDRLKILAESEHFPTMVVAYRQGVLSDQALEKFRSGMLKAKETEKGRDAMANFRVTSFEPIPKDFAEQLHTIVKAYPQPPK